jgi:hypothetical protein
VSGVIRSSQFGSHWIAWPAFEDVVYRTRI